MSNVCVMLPMKNVALREGQKFCILKRLFATGIIPNVTQQNGPHETTGFYPLKVTQPIESKPYLLKIRPTREIVAISSRPYLARCLSAQRCRCYVRKYSLR